MGTLPLDSMLRGAMPALDPWRPHQAFCASERPSIFKFSDAHYLGSYVSPEYQVRLLHLADLATFGWVSVLACKILTVKGGRHPGRNFIS